MTMPSNFSAEKIVRTVPNDFVLFESWPEYRIETTFPHWMKAARIPSNILGLRSTLWPITLETYFGDEEPQGLPSPKDAPLRILVWQPLTMRNKVEGWFRSRIVTDMLNVKPAGMHSFAQFYTDRPHYVEWSRTQRNQRHAWHRNLLNISYQMEEVAPEIFYEAFKQSDTYQNIIQNPFTAIRFAHVAYTLLKTSAVTCRIVRSMENSTIVAGTATIDSVSHRASYYLYGFLTSRNQKHPVMTGLIDAWMEDSKEKGFSNVQFGYCVDEHSPKSWRGFSQFKLQFGAKVIEMPPPLFKIL